MTRTAPRPAGQDVVGQEQGVVDRYAAEVPREALRAVLPLLREIGDLKRVRTAAGGGGTDGHGGTAGGASFAERAFRGSWARLARGEDPGDVAARASASAVAGARLAGVDGPVLRRCGLTADEAVAVLERSVTQHTGQVGPLTSVLLHEALPGLAEDPDEDPDGTQDRYHRYRSKSSYGAQQSYGASGPSGVTERYEGPVPGFVAALCGQPRAGATCPGRPRLVVEPPESHGDHCWAVAVYGVLLAEAFGAGPADVFLLGLAHHLHNAVLPDAGFGGEELLGEHLPRVVARLTLEQLAVLPGPLAARLGPLLALREAAEAPVARAFHAADVLDRVLQVRHHARAAAFTAEQALDDLNLVHPCTVSGFQQAVLGAAEAV